MEPTRWGICGAGNISEDFVVALSLLPKTDHQVVAVAARDKNRAAEFAKKHGIGKACDSYADLVKLADVDIVYVGVVNSEHKPIAVQALNAGKHVLCEKPLTVSQKDTQELIALARSKKVLLVEGFWTAFFPVWKEIRKSVDAGELGDVKFLSANFTIMSFAQAGSPVLDMKLGGGQLMSFGYYPVMLASAIFKEYPEKISAVGFHKHGADDTASIQLVYSNNRMAHLSYSGSVASPCTAAIVGSKGSLHVPEFFWNPDQYVRGGVTKKFDLPVAGSTGVKFHFPRSEGLVYEAEALRQCLLKGQIECPEVPLAITEITAKLLDEIRRQLGINFQLGDR